MLIDNLKTPQITKNHNFKINNDFYIITHHQSINNISIEPGMIYCKNIIPYIKRIRFINDQKKTIIPMLFTKSTYNNKSIGFCNLNDFKNTDELYFTDSDCLEEYFIDKTLFNQILNFTKLFDYKLFNDLYEEKIGYTDNSFIAISNLYFDFKRIDTYIKTPINGLYYHIQNDTDEPFDTEELIMLYKNNVKNIHNNACYEIINYNNTLNSNPVLIDCLKHFTNDKSFNTLKKDFIQNKKILNEFNLTIDINNNDISVIIPFKNNFDNEFKLPKFKMQLSPKTIKTMFLYYPFNDTISIKNLIPVNNKNINDNFIITDYDTYISKENAKLTVFDAFFKQNNKWQTIKLVLNAQYAHLKTDLINIIDLLKQISTRNKTNNVKLNSDSLYADKIISFYNYLFNEIYHDPYYNYDDYNDNDNDYNDNYDDDYDDDYDDPYNNLAISNAEHYNQLISEPLFND